MKFTLAVLKYLITFIFQYLDALAQQRLCNSVRDEIDSFLKGLNGIIPDNLLSIFDENELEVSSCLHLIVNEKISTMSQCFKINFSL